MSGPRLALVSIVATATLACHVRDAGIVAPLACNAGDTGIVAPGAHVRKLAGDFQFTEGPAADAQGNVYFSDIPNNRILRWSVDGALSTVVEKSGGANGLCFDRNGNLVACQSDARRLVSLSPAGQIFVLAEQFDGGRLNSPNDLWVDPKGGIYFSDPRYGNRQSMVQTGEDVYYLMADYRIILRVIRDMVRPNGLIGTPDGKMLYVADAGVGRTYSFRIDRDGTLYNRKLFAPQGSDGMTIDEQGNVYLTGNVVTVYNKKGQRIEELAVPEPPSNLTFGGRDNRTLFITARTSLYALQMQVRGAPTPIRPDKK